MSHFFIPQLLISIRHRHFRTSRSFDIINNVGSLMGWNRGGGGRAAVAQRCRVERGPINQPQISMHGTFA